MLQLLCLVLVTVHATFGLQYVLQTGKVLFPEWNVKKWEQVDDSIRGGKSVSHLSGNKTVLFYGNVDTTTLGGAGFASQRYTFDEPIDASKYRGIKLSLGKCDSKEYSLNLFPEKYIDRGDGRKASQLNFKVRFYPESVLYFYWDEFRGNYRGKETSDRLDPKRIHGLSIMMQSFFDQQDGDFELELESISFF
ncbi:hypothetical protein HK103_002045 [Boothiomyces macroporosus]|uniref:NADH:ubiquinone oxidoreductase intermediate-associated protein 30 domain-containing protein n=1 Tax=Boothiomyces macroporosus TaxID=261099 RepID=A0AAD5U9W6_9FUNG|nr:hypothetical protein HK103_002045 [Boothiomyces macroporosus]